MQSVPAVGHQLRSGLQSDLIKEPALQGRSKDQLLYRFGQLTTAPAKLTVKDHIILALAKGPLNRADVVRSVSNARYELTPGLMDKHNLFVLDDGLYRLEEEGHARAAALANVATVEAAD